MKHHSWGQESTAIHVQSYSVTFLVCASSQVHAPFTCVRYFFLGTIPFLSFGTASNRPILCNRPTVFNLAASTERAIISTLVFTAVLISEPVDLGEVFCCTQLDCRAVQLCFLPYLLTLSVFCGQGISLQMALALGTVTSWRRDLLFTDSFKYFILKLSIPRIFRLLYSVYFTN